MKNLFSRFSIEAEKLFRIYPEFEVPEEQKTAFLRDRTGCIIGAPLAERLNLKLGDRIPIAGDIFPVNLELTVRAIYHSPRDSENLFFHDEYMRESLKAGFKDVASMFVIRAESLDAIPLVTREIDEAFRNFARYRMEQEAWLLGRFVCPAARLAEMVPLVRELCQGRGSIPFAALGRGGG